MPAPEKKFKVGACAASIFVNKVNTPEGPRRLKTISLQRIYRTRDGKTGFTPNLRVADLPNAIQALRQAHEDIYREQTEE